MTRPDRSRTAWWIPRPSTLFTAMVAGLPLGGAITLAHYFGVPLASSLLGYFFGYQMIPRGGTAILDAGALAADIALTLALLASACATTQILACRLAPSARLTVRSACLWIVAFALYLGLLRTEFFALLLLLIPGFSYALASPILLLVLWIGSRGEDLQEGS